MRRGDRAWLAIAAGVVTYNISSPEDEMLSVAADRYISSRPVLTRLVISAVALHLMNLIPEKTDPIHIGFVATREVKKWWSWSGGGRSSGLKDSTR